MTAARVGPGDQPAAGVVFLDLQVAVTADPSGRYRPREQAQPWLSGGGRLGLLAATAATGSTAELRAILEDAGIAELFEPELILLAAQLPLPRPDRRFFAAAAAIAGIAPEHCLFVSTSPATRSAAAAAGLQLAPELADEPEAQLAGADADAGEVEAEQARLAGVLVNPDSGPTFVLHGRLVTMDASLGVIDEARLVVSNGRVAAILRPGQAVPARYRQAPELQTGGTIYPGLIDLHNHLVYDVLPLWDVPRRFDNRTQWPRQPSYPAQVSLPVRALADDPGTARAIVRYVEAKALLGGTTTAQGMRTRVNGGPRLFRGALRNVEQTGDPDLPEAATRVPSLYPTADRVAEFRRGLDQRTAYFYHLAEGVDAAARRTFSDLTDNDLIQQSLVGIHCLGLAAEDWPTMRAARAKAVWSPFSNLLLYGRTLDIAQLAQSGVPFALGCDWSPSGSKNLLQELKVARWEADRQDAGLSDQALVRAVTSQAAEAVGWQRRLGSLVERAYADLIVLTGADQDPYAQLVHATERDIRLVAVHGIARYGDRDLMTALHADGEAPLEDIEVAGSTKSLYLYASTSNLNELTLAQAGSRLRDALADLPGFREQSQQDRAQLSSLDLPPPFSVDVDDEWLAEDSEDEATLAADWSKIADSVELDGLWVGGDGYWDTVEQQANLDAGLKTYLREQYR
ncbi:MAG TPA: amidohydrolase family protein [Jatrophihabitans sp.]|jgi:cytosine/adenosine deaminase-related metal-dependent hydrolase|nr:amidohydrolase family protein [Jatrophihabitans sp.]